MPNRVGQQLGNYRLLRLLGRGGFAEVYLGEHIYLKRRAALKVLHTSLEDEDVEPFLAEAQTLARLNHPQVPTRPCGCGCGWKAKGRLA